MNRQSQQLVVASVVAFLTSGVITLAGLSAAEEMQHMDGGGTYTQPSGSTSYTPPADGGSTYQAPATNTYTAPTNTAPVYQDSGTTHYQQPAGDWSRGTSTSTFTQPSGTQYPSHEGGMMGGEEGGRFQGGPQGRFQGQGGTTAPVGGANQDPCVPGGAQHPWGGALSNPCPTGGFRGAGFQKDGFDFKKGGAGKFDHEPTDDEMKKYGGSDMGDASGKKGIFGKGGARSEYPMDGDMKSKMKMMHGAPEGFGDEKSVGVGGGNFDMSQFDQFVPKKSNANVDSLLDSFSAGDSDASPTLTTAQESKVEKTLDKADAAGEKAVSGLQKVFDKKPTKSAATKATNYILTLVKQWVSVQKLADGLGDFESDVVEHADESATSFADTISEACDTASDFFDGKWKGEKVCDKVSEQIHAAAGEEEEAF